MIGEHALWRFLDYAADEIARPHLGYLCDKTHPITGDVLDYCSPQVDSLSTLLTEFIATASYEFTGTLYRLEATDRGAWFHRSPIFTGAQASWQMEQFFLASLFRVVRTCTDHDWLPPMVSVNSRARRVPVPDEWRSIDIKWGMPQTSFFIPAKDLAERPKSSSIGRHYDESNRRRPTPQFRELVRRQVVWGGIGLATTADECGLTEITLQRWLKKRGTSYSQILEEERYKRAEELLRTNRSIADISDSLGYRYPENFTRAFKRRTGQSPDSYRQTRSRAP